MSDLLPDPPDSAHHWSIMTLASHLRVRPGAVLALLADGSDEEALSPDVRSNRLGFSFEDADGWSHGDCWLWGEASARVAAALPAASIARAIIAAGPLEAAQTISGPALTTLAQAFLDGAS